MIVLGVVGGFARAYNSRNPDLQLPQPASSPDVEDEDTKMVDLAADIVYPYDLGNDSSVICLVGNFIGHHNGAVITCDSAVRYGDQRLECFGSVLINKNDTYIYGDRADYDGVTSKAEVYSPLVKVVDGDATLYTYRFKFDTKLNIGEFDDGGVITNRDNILEAERGYYYADTHEMIGVDAVEMRNDSYQMTGDSVIYNIETDNARFFEHTNIWNDKGEYLYADRGDYDRSEEKYVITRNGYILTELREVWSDSLDYWRETGYALLRRDIQIDDSEHKILSFGDWGEYWDEYGDALLTLEPAVISYDPEQGDSLFMRADTIMMHTRSTLRDREEAEAARLADGNENTETVAERKAEFAVPVAEIAAAEAAVPNLLEESSERPESEPVAEEESPSEEISGESEDEPSVSDVEQDSSEAESDMESEVAEEVEAEVPLSELSKEERKARLREIAEQERAEKQRKAAEKKKARELELKRKLEEIADRRRAKRKAQLEKQNRRDSTVRAKQTLREEARRRKMLARLSRKGIKLQPADASVLSQIDSMMFAEIYLNDSVAHARLDSIIASWQPDSAVLDSVAVEMDTVYRLTRGFRNVRIFRSDFQAVCDSLSSSTLDSVIRMYIEPVLWNGQNQITSEQTDIHTLNQAIDYAEFIGKPMMISKLDTLHYNQVAGKSMYSRFRNNEIYRDDVNGNAQTIYYMQDDATGDIQGLMYITSADMTFYIEEQEITGITYRGTPEYWLYPMEKIPESQELFLQGFTWQEERRPLQDSVFTRVLRPSVREEKELLERPKFPIAERIGQYKMRLLEQGRWYDRSDTLTEDVIYWLDMNTDWREQNERSRESRERRTGHRRAED